jgi:predicted esterase
MKNLVLFAHGKESGPWGSKIKHLAAIAERHPCKVLSPDYRDTPNPDARVQQLLKMDLIPYEKLILVGSSMGGYVSTLASQSLKPEGLFLMAPAFYMPDYADQAPVSGASKNCVIFGWQDEVIPVEHGIRFAQHQRAELHLFDSDHRLDSVLPEVGKIFESFLISSLSPKLND